MAIRKNAKVFSERFSFLYKSSMGRKPKPAGEKKTSVLRILLTEKDRVALDKAAKKVNLDTSTWARMKLLELLKAD